MIKFDEPQYKAWFNSMVDDLTKAKEQETPVVFLDEAFFAFITFKTKAWSSAYSSIKVNDLLS